MVCPLRANRRPEQVQQRAKTKLRCSITSSAMASRPGGKVSPSVFAVVRLMTNSSLVDCMTGRSAGFSLGSGVAINWRYSTNSSAMDPRGARAALDARALAERADGRGEEVARGGSPRGVVRVTRPGACLSPAPPARRRPRGRAAVPPRRRARFDHRAL